MNILTTPRRLLGLLLLIAGLAGLIWLVTSKEMSPTASKVKVAATFYPLQAMAQAIGGDLVEVTTITPAGAEPHDYQPSPQQLVALQQSDLLLYNGASFEPWITNYLKEYDHVAVASSHGLPLLPADSSHKSAQTDPHFWLDPVMAEQMVATVRDGLQKVDPTHAATYQRQSDNYQAQLQQLDASYKQGFADCRLDTVVTSHEALQYLANRYHFKVVSIAGISPEEEPNPATLAELAQLVKAKGIKVVLFEKLVSPRLAQTLASETGAATAIFDPVEGLSEADAQSGQNFISIQQDNLQSLRKARQCQ